MKREQNRRVPASPVGVSRGLFGSVLVFSVFTNLLMLTGPLFMLQVYDRVLGSRSEETLVALVMLVASLYLFYGLLEWARGRLMARIGARFQSETGPRIHAAIIERAALRATPKGGTALQDLEAMRNLYASPVLLAAADVPWTPVFLAAIFLFHWQLGWLALAGGGTLVTITLANQVLTRARVAEAQAAFARAGSLARQAEGAAEFVWAQGMAGAMGLRWQAVQEAALAASVTAADRTGSFSAFTKAFRLLLQSAILGLGAWLVLKGEMTGGAMIAGSILMGRALTPVEQVLGQWPVILRARTGWASLREFLEAVPTRDAPTELPRPRGALSLKGVSVLARPAQPPILSGVGFDLAPGEALGVIGRSGAGKSTLARVILGLVAPHAGEVRLDGATLEQFGAERLGQLVGYLPQEVALFDGTIAENIAQMEVAHDAARVVEAARRAQVHEVILKLPKGYDTDVGAGEVQLSGGQKQRLALARALYGDPVLLVLDEPSSALDAEGSEALNRAVREMKEADGSVILMTHRPAAIASCDKLLVLEAGRVTAFGPRDEVLRSMVRNAGDIARVVKTEARG